jgi:Tfp pilus assembly protein PilF
MAMNFLQFFFLACGVAAVIFSIVSLLVLIKLKDNKTPSNKYELEKYLLEKDRIAVAEAFWQRANIFLKNGQVNAAFEDCKQVLEFNPNHTAAKRLWNHVLPPELVSEAPHEKAIILAAKKQE